jgi:hypothetical protein
MTRAAQPAFHGLCVITVDHKDFSEVCLTFGQNPLANEIRGQVFAPD